MLLIVRHGRTDANRSGLLLGRADPDLDELGRRQAAALADDIGPVDRVITSPLARTRQTAAAFTATPEVDERWIELDYGDWDGTPTADVPADVWRQWRADPDFAPPGGESLAALGTRVRAACDDLAGLDGGERVVVVTHVSPIKAAVGWALGVGDAAAWRTYVAQASLTRIATTPNPSLHSFNEVAHLDGVD